MVAYAAEDPPYRRGIRAMVRTGSCSRNSSTIRLQSSGFSTSSPWDVPGTTASPPGQGAVHVDGVLQPDLVVFLTLTGQPDKDKEPAR
jgi:hypothetical protein